MTMKENQDTSIFYSRNFTMEMNPLTSKCKETYEPDDSRANIDLPALETIVSDENFMAVEVISIDNDSGTIDSPRKYDQSRLPDNVSGQQKDSDTLSHFTHEIESWKQMSIEHKSSVTVKEFTHCNGDEYSSSHKDGASDLSKTDTSVFTDKNVLDCESPELEFMKDICIDNGRPEDDKKLFPLNPEEIKEASSIEVDNSRAASQCEVKEGNDGKFLDQESLKSFSLGLSEKDAVENRDPLKLVQTGEEMFALKNNSEMDFLADEKSLIPEYGSQDSHRPVLDSLDGEGNKTTLLPDQILSQNPIREGPNEFSPEAGKSDGDVLPKSMLHTSDVETETITFNFSNTEKVLCTSSSLSLPHQQSPSVDNMNPDCLSADSKIHPVSSKTSTEENAHEQLKDGNSDDSCLEQFSGEKSLSPTNDDAPAVKPDDEKQEQHGQNEQGETSFSAVTYSGPIAFSGSLSHRSDASTSARSFAFPILQSEWNSSPVRMAKADRRHFRKQKGWRSGILCCRF